MSPSSAAAAIRIAAPWLTSTTSPSTAADEPLHGGQETRPQVERGLPAGQPRVQLAAPPGVVDLEERLERRLVGAAFQVADGHLVHPVDHLDREPVHGGHRGGGLLGPDRPARRARRAPGGRPAGGPARPPGRGPARRAAHPGGRLSRTCVGVGRRASVPGEHEPHAGAPGAQAGEPALGGGERRRVGAVLRDRPGADAGCRAVRARRRGDRSRGSARGRSAGAARPAPRPSRARRCGRCSRGGTSTRRAGP